MTYLPERQTRCVNQTNIVVGDLIDEAWEDPSTAAWRYEYDNIYVRRCTAKDFIVNV